MSTEAIVLWLHLMAAIFWVGGQLFLVIVMVPVLSRAVPAAERTLLAAAVGRRFGVAGAVALVVLVGTGVANAVLRGVTWTSFTSSPYGRLLGVKIVLAGVMLAVSAVHGLYYGGRLEELARQEREHPQLARRRRDLQARSVRFSAINLFLNLVIVLLAVQLGEMAGPH